MSNRFPRILTTFLIIVAMPMAAVAGEAIGKQRGGGNIMDWELQSTGHESATLIWSCADGAVGTAEFKNGKRVSLSTSDLGADVADGACSWELRLTPKVSPSVAKKLADARAANDDNAARKAMKDAGFDPDAMVMSGAFTIRNGMFVNTDEVEAEANDSATARRITTDAARPSGPIAVNDQVIPDDLIVQGSLCVGFDCVNNESFGFDTIRLKENNTRIKFEDTSVGSFPTNDWQLTANDSASGGASKFSVEDITGAKVPMTITAGATTNSIFVDSTGRVGFRTSTPVLDAHINTSNTPGIRLEQNNTGGFTAQTWDIAGNEANFFIRDVTGGSRLPFRIRPGALTSTIDISADSNVGIGTASPDIKLHVDLDGAGFFGISDNDGSGVNTSWTSFYNGGAGDGSALFWAENTAFRWGTTDSIDGVGFVERMRITGTGNVGIGTLGPTSKLHVNGGDIRVSGGSFIDDGTTLNVPDYVFEDSYSLMPLAELDSFIRENKHLPNVPSAANVKAAGLNLSQMQMRLLEKVEELTLYTLDQHKTISELKALNDSLAARLQALEAQKQ